MGGSLSGCCSQNEADWGMPAAGCKMRMCTAIHQPPWPPARSCRGTLVKPGDAGSSEQCTIVVASESCARLPREALG